jgi:hypothetical protein
MKPPGALKGWVPEAPAEHKDLMIKVPDIAENGAVVPVDVTSNIPNTISIAILVDKNPFPLTAAVRVCQWRPARNFGARSSWARPRWSRLSPRRTASSTSPRRKSRSPSAAAAADPNNDRTKEKHGRSDEDSRPDEGRRRRNPRPDEPRDGNRPAQGRAGNTVPAHFIQSDHGRGRRQARRRWPDRRLAVSRNPVFGFKMKGAKAGDKVVVNWVDNKGDKRTDEAVIA